MLLLLGLIVWLRQLLFTSVATSTTPNAGNGVHSPLRHVIIPTLKSMSEWWYLVRVRFRVRVNGENVGIEPCRNDDMSEWKRTH